MVNAVVSDPVRVTICIAESRLELCPGATKRLPNADFAMNQTAVYSKQPQ